MNGTERYRRNPMSETSDAIRDAGIALENPDFGNQPCSIPDSVLELARAGRQIADAISVTAAPGKDETGGTVVCLTEAVMGITAGLCRIADAIGDLAEAIRERAQCPEEDEAMPGS
jgi:hypothetical protein